MDAPIATSSPRSLSLPSTVISPCAACKILRRRCVIDECLLAPYFPPTEIQKFIIAHRVFGASNIIKFLQEVPECQRSDAVSSMVYESFARVRDPVYGCAGTICHLQKQVRELQAELVKTQAQLLHFQSNQASLDALIDNSSFLSPDQEYQQLTTYLLHNQYLVDDDLTLMNYTNWESQLGA